ncbi:MAG: S8 family serine peptidase [Planctomycetes bacterium]|nr:S8 family serine peptidase [Planctomycetota bacterium]
MFSPPGEKPSCLLLVLLGSLLFFSFDANARAESFNNGGRAIDLAVDASEIGVLFDARLDAGVARELVASLPFVAADAAARAPYAPGHLMMVATVPGTTEDQLLAGLRAFGERPEVLAAGPRFLDGMEPYFLTDEILVRYAPGVGPAAVTSIEEAFSLARSGVLAYSENPGVVYRLPHGRSLDALAVTRSIHETGLVEFAIPDFSITRVPLATTNDPLYGNQWHLHNTGQGGAKVDADVDAPEAWDFGRGDPGLTIAVIDTGVELAHPDLTPNLVQGTDVLDDDSNPQAEDYLFGLFTENHSTSVCGVASGAGNNGIGTSGAAQQCKIMPIRFLSEFILVQPTVQDEADAFNWAHAHGADVINCSWGPSGAAALPASTKAAIDDAVDNGRGGKGILIFFAAGNSAADTSGNGYVTYSKTMAVSASTDQDLLASYSSFGAAVDFCAPSNGGVTSGIWTTDRLGSTGYSSGDYTGEFGGTSSASPLAAGVALLVLSADETLSWQQVRTIMRETAVKIDLAGGAYDGNGHSNKYGYGRVNAHDAVVAALGPAGVAFYGSGLPGAGGNVPVIATSGATPHVGNSNFAVTLANARASSTIGYLFGVNSASVPFGGGTVLVDLAPPSFVLVTTASAAGAFTLPVPIPNNGAYIGAKFYSQWLVVDPAATGGYAMTRGMEVTVQP